MDERLRQVSCRCRRNSVLGHKASDGRLGPSSSIEHPSPAPP